MVRELLVCSPSFTRALSTTTVHTSTVQNGGALRQTIMTLTNCGESACQVSYPVSVVDELLF